MISHDVFRNYSNNHVDNKSDNVQYVTLKSGNTLAYCCYGSKTAMPLFLLHGLGSDMYAYSYKYLIAHLVDAGYFVIVHDFRDSGLSSYIQTNTNKKHYLKLIMKCIIEYFTMGNDMIKTKIKFPYTLEDIASDTIELMDHLEIRHAHIFGHSMGGMVAQIISFMYNERVLSLTLLNTSYGPSIGMYYPNVLRLYMLFNMVPNKSECPYEELYKMRLKFCKINSGKNWDEDLHGEIITKKILSSILHENDKQENKKYGSLHQTMAVLRSPSRLVELQNMQIHPSSRIPIQIFHSEKDLIIPCKNSKFMNEFVPYTNLKIFKNDGHVKSKHICNEIILYYKQLMRHYK